MKTLTKSMGKDLHFNYGRTIKEAEDFNDAIYINTDRHLDAYVNETYTIKTLIEKIRDTSTDLDHLLVLCTVYSKCKNSVTDDSWICIKYE